MMMPNAAPALLHSIATGSGGARTLMWTVPVAGVVSKYWSSSIASSVGKWVARAG